MSVSSLAFFVDLEPAVADFQESVIEGLSNTPKSLACKFFYDEVGSDLFGKICETDEYYVTRTETALMRDIGPELAKLAGPDATVIELGAGSDLKIRLLLDALDRPAQYVPIDISREHLREAANAIAIDYPALRVGAVCADFTAQMALAEDAILSTAGRRLGFFPGSTIGNFSPIAAEDFLRGLRPLLGADGALLIGADLRKDTARLNAAYNDKAGYTAAFNMNILYRIVKELDVILEPRDFEHYAFYNEAENRIEMHLRCLRAQTVRVGGRSFDMMPGELIHTENSHKYSLDGFAALAASAGYTATAHWTDTEKLFSIHYLTVAA